MSTSEFPEENPGRGPRNITLNEILSEILLDLEDELNCEPSLPEELGELVDQGYLLDAIAKSTVKRLEQIKGRLLESGEKSLQPLTDKAMSRGVGGSVALAGHWSTVTIRVGKPAMRVVSDAIKSSAPQAVLVEKGWLKLDSRPTLSTSFARKVG